MSRRAQDYVLYEIPNLTALTPPTLLLLCTESVSKRQTGSIQGELPITPDAL